MKKAVIYARYSCEKQTEQSIEGQLRVCNEFAERNGYTVIHNYIDRAVSGKTDKREQFQQMLKDSADKTFEFVIVYKLDRFVRNRYDSAMNKATLKKNGVKVLSSCEQITDTPQEYNPFSGIALWTKNIKSWKAKPQSCASCFPTI